MDQGINEPSKNFPRCILHNAYVMIQGKQHSILVYLLLMVPDNAWLMKIFGSDFGDTFFFVWDTNYFKYFFKIFLLKYRLVICWALCYFVKIIL